MGARFVLVIKMFCNVITSTKLSHNLVNVRQPSKRGDLRASHIHDDGEAVMSYCKSTKVLFMLPHRNLQLPHKDLPCHYTWLLCFPCPHFIVLLIYEYDSTFWL